MNGSKFLEVGRLWSLALLLSAMLAAAGARWPGPLPILPGVVAALVLVPPLLVALVLAARWRLPSTGEGGESPQATESVAQAQERQ